VSFLGISLALFIRDSGGAYSDVDVLVKQQVYDVTEFLDQHPGGSAIILKYAGRDATEEYEPIHPPNALEDNLSVEKRLGEIDLSTLKDLPKADVKSVGKDASKKADEKVPLSQIISMRDFEVRCYSFSDSLSGDRIRLSCSPN
jgi:L-lactate dehydrogenase (cytochrome)